MNEFQWKFQTFGDKIITGMKDNAIEFLELLHKKQYRFLTFSGPSEVGKTFLIKEIKRFILTYPKLFKFDYAKKDIYGKCVYPVIYRTLKEHVSACLNNTKELTDIKNCGILFCEEFLNFNTLNKFNEMVVEIAFDILNSRSEKAVVIDTNKSLDEIENIDTRIKSRLFRNGGIVVDISNKTIRYSERK